MTADNTRRGARLQALQDRQALTRRAAVAPAYPGGDEARRFAPTAVWRASVPAHLRAVARRADFFRAVTRA